MTIYGIRINSAFLEDGDKFEIGDQLIASQLTDEIDREFQAADPSLVRS